MLSRNRTRDRVLRFNGIRVRELVSGGVVELCFMLSPSKGCAAGRPKKAEATRAIRPTVISEGLHTHRNFFISTDGRRQIEAPKHVPKKRRLNPTDMDDPYALWTPGYGVDDDNGLQLDTNEPAGEGILVDEENEEDEEENGVRASQVLEAYGRKQKRYLSSVRIFSCLRVLVTYFESFIGLADENLATVH